MSALTRRSFTIAATTGLATPMFARGARAAEFFLKLGHSHPPDYPTHRRLSAAAEKIEQETNGKVRIELFPSNQLGGDSDMISQVRSGALEMNFTSGPNLGVLAPLASISGVAFAFSSHDKVWAAMDGGLGDKIRSSLVKVGLMPIAPSMELGFREITSSTVPIDKPTDLIGFKIRVPPSPLYSSVFKALGAAPTSLNFNELYTALQTGLVSGHENPLTLIESARLYEVQKYCSLTNHIWDGLWLVANLKVWNQLPADVKEVIGRNFAEAVRLQRSDMATLSGDARKRLEGRGLVFNSPDPEPFREALRKAGFYTSWKERFSADEWTTLEDVSGPLA